MMNRKVEKCLNYAMTVGLIREDVLDCIRDKTIPLEQRWRVYTSLGEILTLGYYVPDFKTLPDNFSWYDELVDSCQMINNVDVISFFEAYAEETTDDADDRSLILSEEQMNELKEEMLQSGHRRWIFDW